MPRCSAFFRRFLFVCIFLLFSALPVHADMQEQTHELSALSSLSGLRPGEPITEAGFNVLLGREQSGGRPRLSWGEACTLLRLCLSERGLTLPERSDDFPANYDPANQYASELLLCYRAGILGSSFDASRIDAPLTAGSACLLAARFLSCCTERSFEQPVSSLPADPAQGPEALENALLMGHSLAHGILLTTVSPLDFAVRDGASVFDYLSTDVRLSESEWGYPLTALQRKEYEKVYIFLGTNDLNAGAYGLDGFEMQLSNLIELTRYYQPEARICLIGIPPIGFDDSVEPCFQTPNIRLYNQLQKTLSRQLGTDYLDIFSALADSDGYNRVDLTRDDGIHYTAEGYELLLRELYTHPLSKAS